MCIQSAYLVLEIIDNTLQRAEAATECRAARVAGFPGMGGKRGSLGNRRNGRNTEL